MRYKGNIHAPKFPTGLEWVNTLRPVTIEGLSGKVILLELLTGGGIRNENYSCHKLYCFQDHFFTNCTWDNRGKAQCKPLDRELDLKVLLISAGESICRRVLPTGPITGRS